MGASVDPAKLTASGEHCLARLSALTLLDLPVPQFATSAMTVIEIHVSRVLARLIVLSDLQATKLGAALVDEMRDDINRTWDTRMSWLSRGFGLAIAGEAEYQRLNNVTELRNAVVHGDGRLTDYQTASLTKVIALQKDLRRHLDVQAAGSIKYGTKTALLVETAIRNFVVFFDGRVLADFPKARKL